ncbi:hypothetical protein BSKO_12368 [Bryopsis sp. KO-2023]|nr:hypothetical protein BSKO_12368 [Bryopsis sp. KO-2023]
MVLLSKDVFPSLPLDVLVKVLSFLPGKNAAQAACVCYDWSKTVDGCDKLWSKIFQTDFGPCRSKPEGVSWHQMYLNEWKWRNGRLTWETIRGHSVECIQLDERGLIVGSMGGPTVINPDDGSCRKFSQGQEVDMFVVTCFKAIGRWIVGGCSLSSEIRIWDADKGECTTRMQGGSSGVLCLDFVGNPPKTVVSGSEDGSIAVWDVASGKCIREMKGHQFMVSSIAFDGNFVVSGSVDRAVKIWPIEFGQCMETWEGHGGAITCLDFDGRCVITGSYDMTARVWDLASSECVMELMHPDEVSCLKSNGRWIITGCADRLIRFWEAETGLCVRTVEGPSKALSLDFDGRRIVGGFENNTLGIWTLADGAENVVTPDNFVIGGVKTGECDSYPAEIVARSGESMLPRKPDLASSRSDSTDRSGNNDGGLYCDAVAITEESLALHSVFSDAADKVLEVGMLADPVSSIESREDEDCRSDERFPAETPVDLHQDGHPHCDPPSEPGNSIEIPKTGIPRYGAGKSFAAVEIEESTPKTTKKVAIEIETVAINEAPSEFFEMDPLGHANGESLKSAVTCDDAASEVSTDFLEDFDEDVAKAIENVLRPNPPSCELNNRHHHQPRMNRRCMSVGSSRIPSPNPSVISLADKQLQHCSSTKQRWEALDRSKSTGSRIPMLRDVAAAVAAPPPSSRLPRRQRIHSVDSDKVFQHSIVGMWYSGSQAASGLPNAASYPSEMNERGRGLEGKDSDEVFVRSGYASAVNKALDSVQDGENHNAVMESSGDLDGGAGAIATEKQEQNQNQKNRRRLHGSSAVEKTLDKGEPTTGAMQEKRKHKDGSSDRKSSACEVPAAIVAFGGEEHRVGVSVEATVVAVQGKGGAKVGVQEKEDDPIDLGEISRVAKRAYEIIAEPDGIAEGTPTAAAAAVGQEEGENSLRERTPKQPHRKKMKSKNKKKKDIPRSKQRNSFFCIPSVLIRAAPFLFLGAWMLIRNCTNNRTP